MRSVFDWVLSGTFGRGVHGVAMFNITSMPESVMSRFWDLESIGVVERSDRDPLVQRFNEGIVYKPEVGRYRVGLAWKERHPPLVDNVRGRFMLETTGEEAGETASAER